MFAIANSLMNMTVLEAMLLALSDEIKLTTS